MHNVIISDTSCFIVLTNIGELNLLQSIYGEVITTTDIATEYGAALPAWVNIHSVTDVNRQQLLELQIDKGESSAIALALEIKNCTVILDDYKARKIATQLGISITGTIGAIPSIKPFLNKIKQTDFRLSPELEAQALVAANEL